MDWKVVDRQYDDGKDYYGREESRSSINRTSEENSIRNEESRSRQTNSQWNNGKIEDGSSTKRNDAISNFNQEQGSIETRSNRKITRDSGNKSELAPTSSFFNESVNRANIKTKLDEHIESQNSISTKDNKGRQLSTQQQEYFKDSKVRDENGNLLTAYHGTNNEFYTFKRRTNDGSGFAPGFYFTINKDGADSYSIFDKSKTKEVYLNIKNPINGLEDSRTNITLKLYFSINLIYGIILHSYLYNL